MGEIQAGGGDDGDVGRAGDGGGLGITDDDALEAAGEVGVGVHDGPHDGVGADGEGGGGVVGDAARGPVIVDLCPDAVRHQVFLEPEGLGTSEMYVNGLSTSHPADVQVAFLRAVPGLEAVEMTRSGYAIEYDYFPPTQVHPTLESRAVPGLFFAGQVNGTTGYEEAAGQGALAGLNPALLVRGEAPVVLTRDQAMTGVMVDDLVHRVSR